MTIEFHKIKKNGLIGNVAKSNKLYQDLLGKEQPVGWIIAETLVSSYSNHHVIADLHKIPVNKPFFNPRFNHSVATLATTSLGALAVGKDDFELSNVAIAINHSNKLEFEHQLKGVFDVYRNELAGADKDGVIDEKSIVALVLVTNNNGYLLGVNVVDYCGNVVVMTNKDDYEEQYYDNINFKKEHHEIIGFIYMNNKAKRLQGDDVANVIRTELNELLVFLMQQSKNEFEYVLKISNKNTNQVELLTFHDFDSANNQIQQMNVIKRVV